MCGLQDRDSYLLTPRSFIRPFWEMMSSVRKWPGRGALWSGGTGAQTSVRGEACCWNDLVEICQGLNH